MTYGVTDQGFNAKSHQEIFSEIKTALKDNLNIDIGYKPDSIANVITNILTLATSEVWDQAQSLQSMFDIDSATGVWLDRLCQFRLVFRKSGAPSVGYLYFVSTGNSVIPKGTEFSDDFGNRFYSTARKNIDLDNGIIYKLDFSSSITVGDRVSFKVNNSETYEIIITVDNLANWQDELIYIVNNSSSNLLMTSTSDGYFVETEDEVEFTISELVNITIPEFTCRTEIAYTSTGDYTFLSNSITNYPAYANISRVYNKYQISGGSLDETDEQLRYRFKLSTGGSGLNNYEAMLSSVYSVAGVTMAGIVENSSDTYDPINELDPHSFKVIVQGGEDANIGAAIFSKKPFGIEAAGSNSVVVLDVNNTKHTVSFDRVRNLNLHVRVSYKKYSEELFPLQGEQLIKSSVATHINNLGVGVDVIQGRVLGSIYSSVAGVGNITVELAYTTDDTVTPSNWSEDTPVPVSSLFRAYTQTGFITVNEV